MSKQTKNNTFYSFAKWFKRASIIVILAPLVLLIMNVIALVKKGWDASWYTTGSEWVAIIVLIASILWIILDVIMIFTAGTIKQQKSALWTRFVLILALALVLSSDIVSVLIAYGTISSTSKAVQIVSIFIPAITMLGFIVGTCEASSIKKCLA